MEYLRRNRKEDFRFEVSLGCAIGRTPSVGVDGRLPQESGGSEMHDLSGARAPGNLAGDPDRHWALICYSGSYFHSLG